MSRATGGVPALALALALGMGGTGRALAQAPVGAQIEARGSLVLDVDQPAYVAVFDVRPSIGIAMIYPRPNDIARTGGHGPQTVRIYMGQVIEEQRALVMPAVSAEEYVYLLASRTPLDVSAFARGPIMFSTNPIFSNMTNDGSARAGRFSQIDSILRGVVPAGGDYAVDVRTLTPDRPVSSTSEWVIGPPSASGDGWTGDQRLAIRCVIGTVVFVETFPFQHCTPPAYQPEYGLFTGATGGVASRDDARAAQAPHMRVPVNNAPHYSTERAAVSGGGERSAAPSWSGGSERSPAPSSSGGSQWSPAPSWSGGSAGGWSGGGGAGVGGASAGGGHVGRP